MLDLLVMMGLAHVCWWSSSERAVGLSRRLLLIRLPLLLSFLLLLLLHHQTSLAFHVQIPENVIDRLIIHIIFTAVMLRSNTSSRLVILRRSFRHGVLSCMLLLLFLLLLLMPAHGFGSVIHAQALHGAPRTSFAAGFVLFFLFHHHTIAVAAFARWCRRAVTHSIVAHGSLCAVPIGNVTTVFASALLAFFRIDTKHINMQNSKKNGERRQQKKCAEMNESEGAFATAGKQRNVIGTHCQFRSSRLACVIGVRSDPDLHSISLLIKHENSGPTSIISVLYTVRSWSLRASLPREHGIIASHTALTRAHQRMRTPRNDGV